MSGIFSLKRFRTLSKPLNSVLFKYYFMNKVEFVFREILFQAIEEKNRTLTQKELSNCLHVSLSTVNLALKPLKRINAVKVNPMNFKIVNPKKILLYWASARDLSGNLIYKTRSDLPVSEIEKRMPTGIVFSAYSAFKFRFKETPADYSEIYVYANDLEEIKKRFPLKEGNENLFVLQADESMQRYGNITCIAQTFVDLWNLPEWYSSDFIKAMEEKLDAVLE